jgi:two-component system phosphate regulon sensor histidine kinase PhoR
MLSNLFLLNVAAISTLAVGFYWGRLFELPTIGVVITACVWISSLTIWHTFKIRQLTQKLWQEQGELTLQDHEHGALSDLKQVIVRLIRQKNQTIATEQANASQIFLAMNATPNGLLLLDADNRIQWMNASASAHFGLHAQKDYAQVVSNLIRAPAFVNYLHKGDFQNPATVVIKPDALVLSVWVCLYGRDKKLVLSQDITDQVRMDVMRRDFVANVSHEMRTPLTVLSGFVETMQDLQLVRDKQLNILAMMASQTGRMQQLIADLLTLARLEGDPLPSTTQWFGFSDMLGSIQQDAQALSSGQHLLRFPDQSSSLKQVQLAGNTTEIYSAISNLVSNAIRYTPASGAINVLWTMREDGSGLLTIQDTGPGIAREHLSRLAQRFYRVDTSRSRETGGTGLGLAIVKHAIERHGGELSIESELGIGSRFKLLIPPNRIRIVGKSE